MVVSHPLSIHNTPASSARGGAAASNAETRKHRRYPGAGLVAAALEVQGRPGEELLRFLRIRANGMEEARRAVFLQEAWQTIAATLQRANAAALDASAASLA